MKDGIYRTAGRRCSNSASSGIFPDGAVTMGKLGPTEVVHILFTGLVYQPHLLGPRESFPFLP